MPGTDRLGFAETLGRRTILMDAAMGTRLIARGLDLASDDPCLWSVDHPEVVLEVHRLDVSSGSEALLTNTFGANRTWLGRVGRGEDVRTINIQAVGLAREAVGLRGFVIGSIGPSYESSDDLTEQAEVLIEGGADALMLETHRLDQAEAGLEALRGLGVPILASLFAWPEPIGESARCLIDTGALAIGANCQSGMAPALRLARRLRSVCDHPLLIKPASGLPGSNLESPESMGAAWSELVALGVRLIGGCCGTTEAHVSAFRDQQRGV